jgi:hypothetical protein
VADGQVDAGQLADVKVPMRYLGFEGTVTVNDIVNMKVGDTLTVKPTKVNRLETLDGAISFPVREFNKGRITL